MRTDRRGERPTRTPLEDEYEQAGWKWQGYLDGSWRITTPDGAVHFVAREYFPRIVEAIQYVIDKRQEIQ